MFKNKKAVIFDMDGTLIDSVGIWNEVDRLLISEIRQDGKQEEENYQQQRDFQLRRFAATENPYLSYCAFLKDKYLSVLSAEEIHNRRYDIAQDYLRSTVDYKPFADIFIRRLKDQGLTLVIASTTRGGNMNIYKKENANILSKAPLDEYFSLIYTREDAKEIKPHPEIYFKVMRTLGLLPEECLVIEDSLIGVEAAKSAGIEVAVIYDKYSDEQRSAINAAADYIFADYKEMLALI